MTPRATVRLQLHASFTFDDAARVLDHYAELGISHLYLSPITQARPGSPHGYDVIDPTRVSEELGGLPGLRRLAARAAARRMGLIADIVPNHLAADARNPWWQDVLRSGRASAHAPAFDIDWEAGGGKLLLPILARPYGDALAGGEIRLLRQDGASRVQAGGQLLPLTDPQADPAAHDPGQPEGRARLHALLENQHYRLAWWRCAAEQLNWRRFFEISELAGVRVEDKTVFEAMHALPLALYAEGLLDGLRVDHIDGLAEPGAYLRRLRAALLAAAPGREPYLVVEKILAPHEALDTRWPVEGSTGYDFMDEVGALLHASPARGPLLAFWRALGGDPAPVAAQIRGVRLALLRRNLASERQAALRAWMAVLAADPRTRDWGEPALRRVLDSWLAGFPIYRSYAEDGAASRADRAAWDEAARQARLGPPDPLLLRDWMDRLSLPAARPALKRLQQLTPPLAAKALEDTFYYRHGPLLSRNEVGAWPQRFALGVPGFHLRNQARQRRHPRGMLATATHDHKRGEDARARLAVLTEMPARWSTLASRWLDTLPEGPLAATDRYMLLQTLVAAWPAAWTEAVRDESAIRQWLARVGAWQRKALREAKLRTSWQDPDPAYEAAAQACLDALDPAAPDRRAWDSLAAIAAPLVAPGQINSLAQTLLRNTAPGVPDLYQAAETWDDSLVDPDNRRAVDHARLGNLLRGPAASPARPRDWTSGRIKQYLIQAALRLRAARPAAFESGYQPVCARGRRAAHVVAYLRGSGEQRVLAVAPRLCSLRLAGLARGEDAAGFWEDTVLELPPGSHWTDVLAGGGCRIGADGRLPLARLLRQWPVALCASEP
ncbi:malto-oligosyltrehalose synthase [Bordetella hinzii]|uniref:malto-oligosyltrehalose synthase n=2 Tax=Bordetella hinzii TaxID=103855 RepID=UPI00045A6CD0|nr:malto-oligosyltrehalose synthase [Bordetella hinzii]KCB45008.1 (1->4)-alpha-D-glucan 1-alpha-D-glucosylmutase [Bordetella hinzii 4161]KXA71117.1 hypothetical protein AXA74_20230 [Bordetella hinzii LMG 13501]MCJ9707864.1 malto-oligosyltrehalose synthase [Bordetella hinzii]QDJ38791.1 malto-oligosyltrehalose synthase [Bordetella hinzii]QDJ47878.1 malto-oligosyltrehalose synthase [Bordetella hinzii]